MTQTMQDCKERGCSFEEQQEEIDKRLNDVLKQEWIVGVYERGHGHQSFGIITREEQLIVKCDSWRELAEHIVIIHNTHIGVTK